MKIIVDTREQKPLEFPVSMRGTLHTGDYSIEGFENRFTVEHKSIADLIGTCDGRKAKGKAKSNRDRFKKELQRMKDGFDFYCIVISGKESDILPQCNKIYNLQLKAEIVKARHRKPGARKPRPPASPTTRAKGVIGSLNSFRVDYNAHFYFLGDKKNAAVWIEEQAAYFVRNLQHT